MYAFTEHFMGDKDNLEYLKTNMMGPNAMRLSEEMASCLEIKPGMRALDLGCGCGLSTLLLAKKYEVSVFAADLWISPTDNYARFQAMGIDDRAVPISVDATKGLPSQTDTLTCCSPWTPTTISVILWRCCPPSCPL